ncbi:MAG: hypothetical protein AAGE84_20900 [Cyanobacteria bacterium P01_G01_bin.39]
MNHTLRVLCPNCGSLATRKYFINSQEARYSSCPQNQVMQTECSCCDYLMVMCVFNGKVIEAQTCSTSMAQKNQQQLVLLPAKLPM